MGAGAHRRDHRHGYRPDRRGRGRRYHNPHPPATNTQRIVKTNAAGIYSIPALLPGTYTLKVEMPGFTTQVRGDVELQVAQVARLDFTLQVGNVAEVIEVAGGAPVLQTETTEIGTVIENRRILELPLNGRNYLQLASLIPGATTCLEQLRWASDGRQCGVAGRTGFTEA